jgi:leucyl/phenylalanyl-tRNA--protein transferase
MGLAQNRHVSHNVRDPFWPPGARREAHAPHQRGENFVARRDNHPANPSEPASASSTEPPSAPARQLSWSHAVSHLRQSRAQLRELRDRGTVRVQRLIGRASTLLPPSPFGGLCGVFDTLPLSVENVLLGFAQGIYAMESHGTVRWHCPPERFVLYLQELKSSSQLRRERTRANYTVSFDRAPRAVIQACAAEHAHGPGGTWLGERLQKIYLELFELGALHTVEAWQDGVLVAGSFGMTMGTVWTSESMFSRAPHAGTVQFAATAEHLIERGFELVDGQQYSEHFARFGAREVPIAEYRAVLARGLAAPVRFHADGARPPLGPPTESAASAPGSTIPGSPASARQASTRKQQQHGRNGGGNHGVS